MRWVCDLVGKLDSSPPASVNVVRSCWGVPVLGERGTRRRRRRQGVVFALIVLIGAVGACSTSGPQAGTQSAGTQTPANSAPPPELASYCSGVIDLLQVLEVGPDISSNATPDDMAAALQKFGARFEPPLTAVEKTVPDVAREDVETLGRQARYAVATKTAAPMNTPEFEAALTRLHINTVRQCGVAEIRVTSTEYKYEGIPPTVAAGALSVSFINLGAEPHEMRVFRISDGDPRPFTVLIGLPQAQRDQELTPITPTLSANPGSTDSEIIKLPLGRYGVACLKPKGSTPTQDGTGPQHATLGEAAEFTAQ